MAEFVMPALGADMEAGTLIAWLRKPGERVDRGDIIAEIDTDKGVIEVECFTAGVVEKLLIEPGDRVPVGTVLAIIGEDGAPGEAQGPRQMPAMQPEPERIRISPLARKMAGRLGVDIAKVAGTGPGGRITSEDIEKAAALKPSEPSVERKPEPAAADRSVRMRQAIAAAMERSKREIPHYYLSTTIDMTRALGYLALENQKRPIEKRLIPAVLAIRAAALALRDYPEFNGYWKDGRFLHADAINTGVAISMRGGGLMAPALIDADEGSIDELMEKFHGLVERVRGGSLRSSELTEPTITITSLGDQGVDAVFGIIYPPQVAILGFGRVVERPWAEGGMLGVRRVMMATLSADHRATDGHRGALFLAAIDRLLQSPDKL